LGEEQQDGDYYERVGTVERIKKRFKNIKSTMKL